MGISLNGFGKLSEKVDHFILIVTLRVARGSDVEMILYDKIPANMAYWSIMPDPNSAKMWGLPKVLIETKQTEGKTENGEVAHDMYFGLRDGSAYTHSGPDSGLDNIDLDVSYVRNNVKLRLAITDDLECEEGTLWKRFEQLVRYTSTGYRPFLRWGCIIAAMLMRNAFPLIGAGLVKESLLSANLGLLKKMKELRSKNIDTDKLEKPEIYSDKAITDAVFEHKKTKEFIQKIHDYTIGLIKTKVGDINDINEKYSINKNIEYSGIAELFDGLKIAVNDTWGHRVTLTEYDIADDRFICKLNIRIFDHFGLNTVDIRRFGTKDLIEKYIKETVNDNLKLKAIDEFVRDDSILNHFRNVSKDNVIPILAEIGAAGFRAWFILQHYHGYRPFVNVMEKDVTIAGLLERTY